MNNRERLRLFRADARFLLNQQGLVTALAPLARRCAQLPCRRMHYIVMAFDLRQPIAAFTPRIPLQIRRFVPDDVRWVEQTQGPRDAYFCRQWLSAGHTGWVAEIHGDCAAHSWGRSAEQTDFDALPLPLSTDDAVFTYVFTMPRWRGNGAQSVLLETRCRHYQESGYERAFSYVQSTNRSSLHAIKRLGGQPIGYIRYRRLGPWRWARFREFLEQLQVSNG